MRKFRHFFTSAKARELGRAIGVDFRQVRLEEFRKGLLVELEHDRGRRTNVTHGDLKLTAKIALAHLLELPDYYTRLLKMEREAKGER